MSRTTAQVATHVVRSHRALRRRLPHLHDLARRADQPAREDAGVRAARHGAAFLDREVLAHADVEDEVLDRYLDGTPVRGAAVRLQPQHDTLREVSIGLHGHADAPTGRTDVAGLLHGVADMLHAHLDDEWQVLLPALSQLDPITCATSDALATVTLARPSARLYLPAPRQAVERLLTRRSHGLQTRLAAAATDALQRSARRLGVPIREQLGLALDLAPAVQSPHVGLHVGSLRTQEIETVVSPVELELTLTPRGDSFTVLEVHHVLTPTRPLPSNAPAHELTDALVHAVIGELAGIAGARTAIDADRLRAPDGGVAMTDGGPDMTAAASIHDAVATLHDQWRSRVQRWHQVAQQLPMLPATDQRTAIEHILEDVEHHLVPYMQLEEQLLDGTDAAFLGLEHAAVRRALDGLEVASRATQLDAHALQAALASACTVLLDHLRHEHTTYVPQLRR